MPASTIPSFPKLSQEIANEFIQSIVFLDDAAYIKEESNTQREFDTIKISQVFAKEKKICSVYGPQNIQDIDDFCYIAEKADIVILDWYIKLVELETLDDDPNKDAEEDDIRGKYTEQIIKVLAENNDSLKLIIVYTGETDLIDILKKLKKALPTFTESESQCELKSKNIKIIIRAKSNLSDQEAEEQYKHNPQLKNKIISYEKLPQHVLHEFTEMTLGILPNIALQSLTAIRKNTHKILSQFSKELDAAYLGHKVLLPVQTDAEPFLLELFVDTLLDLLSYQNIAEDSHTKLIPAWINHYIKKEGRLSSLSKTIVVNPDTLIKLVTLNKNSAEDRLKDVFQTSNNKVNDASKKKSFSRLFLNDEELKLADTKEFSFIKLTQHKSLFLPRLTIPALTLGTIIKCIKSNDFFICIQQVCDSVRVSKDEERRFLFLPLEQYNEQSNGIFDFIITEDIKLKLKKHTYDLKTIKFKTNNTQGTISSIKDENNVFIFENTYGEKYQWILDIKRLQVQNVINKYASSLTRVGINESEWLRRRSTNSIS